MAAQELGLQVTRGPATLQVQARVLAPDAAEVLAALERGLTAEIEYQVRLLETRQGLFAVFGARQVSQVSVTLTARWDRFEDRYVITTQDGTTTHHQSPVDFEAAFYRVRDLNLWPLTDLSPGIYYVSARFRLQSVRLVPPLDLITIIGSGAITSPWVQAPVPEG